MKVVHLWRSSTITGGGGGVFMGQLHRELRRQGIDSMVMQEPWVEDSDQADQTIRSVPHWRLVDGSLRRLLSPLGLLDVNRMSSFALRFDREIREADVLHLHGTHSAFFNYLALSFVTRNKPVVFTLHDMWAVTGHCGFSLDCERWETGCGGCPYPWMYPEMRRDTSRVQWKLKRAAYRRSNMTFVAPCAWMEDIATRGLKNHDVVRIPYGIDTRRFSPMDRGTARASLGIEPNELVVMFAAVNASDWRKGPDLLRRSLELLPGAVRDRLVLLIMGRDGEDFSGVPGRAIQLGRIDDDEAKAKAYAASDVFVLPTRAETTGLVLLESMSCGTPVVGFAVGGVPEVILNSENGALAEPENPEDLARAIGSVLLADEQAYARMRECARDSALARYDLGDCARSYSELYERLVGTPSLSVGR